MQKVNQRYLPIYTSVHSQRSSDIFSVQQNFFHSSREADRDSDSACPEKTHNAKVCNHGYQDNPECFDSPPTFQRPVSKSLYSLFKFEYTKSTLN